LFCLFVCFLLCVFCVFVLFCILLLLLYIAVSFLFFIKVYRPLPPGVNPIAVNIYLTMSGYRKARQSPVSLQPHKKTSSYIPRCEYFSLTAGDVFQLSKFIPLDMCARPFLVGNRHCLWYLLSYFFCRTMNFCPILRAVIFCHQTANLVLKVNITVILIR